MILLIPGRQFWRSLIKPKPTRGEQMNTDITKIMDKDTLALARKAVLEHLKDMVSHIHRDIDTDKDLLADYDVLLKKKNGGEFPPHFKHLQELRDELSRAIIYVLIAHNIWPIIDRSILPVEEKE
jgi:hypothetical protein